MDDTKKAADAIQALATASSGRTKTGRLRSLLPQIEAAQLAGVTHEKILQTLNEQGFDLTMKAYSVMLWRIRNKQTKETAALPAPPVKSVTPAPIEKRTPKKAEISTATATAEPRKPGQPEKFEWDLEKNKTPEW